MEYWILYDTEVGEGRSI